MNKKTISICVALLLTSNVYADFSTLPPQHMLDSIILNSKTISVLDKNEDVEISKAREITKDPYDWNIKFNYQNRKARGLTTESFNEQSVALEKQIRGVGKAAIDDELSSQTIVLSAIKKADAIKEYKRTFLKHWFSYVKDSETLVFLDDLSKLLEKDLELTNKKYKLGDGNKLEVLLNESLNSQVVLSKNQVLQRKHEVELILKNKYSGLVLESVVVEDPSLIGINLEDYSRDYLKNSRELEYLSGDSKLKEIQIRRNDKNKLGDPTIGIYSSRERGGEEAVVGLSLSIPIGGTYRSSVLQTSIKEAELSHEREGVRINELKLEALNNWNRNKSLLDIYGISKLNTKTLADNLYLTKKSYFLGESKLQDVIQAQRFFNEAKILEIQTKIDYLESYYNMLLDINKFWI